VGWLVWLGIALVLAATEVATLAFVGILLAGGALIGALAAAVGLPVWVQVVVAVIVSVLLLTTVRKSALARWAPQGPARVGVAADIGRIGVVVETVTEFGGRIKLPGDAVWSARLAPDETQASPPGEQVQVVRIEGATAIVVRPRQESPS
jgi:membrane protein implicated in regulation of membrane protease activity